MQTLLIAAAAVAIATGLVHSLVGEILIFRHLKNGGAVPNMSAPPLKERNIRIIWASWHLATVFGWAFAALLLQVAFARAPSSLACAVLHAAACANLGGAILVLIGTKGRHPGWIALLVVAVLVWLAANVA